ncbi:undecaprenyl-diphosphatase [Rhodothalassium salexigens]|uniref:undecaprenyl-diphosphate phosphatase n=1 Tax=Rhodothalassium salexigens TaxID=1086 RepID=UPI001914C64C|nr:undecaprenyl-diphosphate phosphatase [Rhodothalassium salexigens]MBK5909956.1 undecaprenyl-diphosphatase [Rhodothalassium salexigens]
MPLLHLLVLALVQGVTEFLPISSSAHLILVPAVTGWPDQGPVMDLAMHVGTLVAVLVYFRRDTVGLTWAVLAAVRVPAARRAVAGTPYAGLLAALLVATVPVVAAGGLLAALDLVDLLRRPDVIAAASIGFGLLLYGVDMRAPRQRRMSHMGRRPALLIGLAQVLALIPGTSRAGITMTAARALGFRRPDAARFSMLLAIPTILAGGALAAADLAAEGAAGRWRDALIGAGLAFAFALAAIHFLMRWLQRASMTIFVVYRVALGLALLALIGAGVL